MYILTIAWLVVAVVGCGGSASPTGAAVGCEDGTLKPCTCDDGSKSTASCASGVYGACDCQPADGSSRAGDSSGADAVQPDAAQPDTAQPDTAQPDTAQPDTAQPDVLPADIAQPDTAQPDTAQPDTAQPETTPTDTATPPSTCQSDKECKNFGLVCDPLTKKCVTCLSDAECAASQHCVGLTCQGYTTCSNSLGCKAAKGPDGKDQPICDQGLGECSACLSAADCPASHDCKAKQCVPFKTCQNSTECGKDEVCNKSNNRCVQCLGDNDCGANQLCEEGKCNPFVPCSSDKQCTPLGLLCDASKGKCAQCLQNVDCPDIYNCQNVGVAKTGLCVLDACAQGQGACSNNSKVTCNSVGDGYGSPQACASQTTCVAPGGKPECKAWVCTPGLSCLGDKAVECSSDGLLVDKTTDCVATSQKCFGGECKTQVCAPGQSFCDGQVVKLCDTQGLTGAAQKTCGQTEFCDGGTCKAQVCTPGQKLCAGNTVTTCNANGSGNVAGGADCGADKCAAGSCMPVVCTAGQLFCDGSAVKQCDAAGISSTPVKTCGVSEFCEAGSCKAQVCAPTLPACNGNSATTCNNTGSGYVGGATSCGSQVCFAGECKTLVCQPAAIFCDGAGKLSTCSPTGTAVVATKACDIGYFCGTGKSGDAGCLPVVCDPGKLTCSGTFATTCKVDGSGYQATGTECATSGKVCSAGSCVSLKCDPQNPLYCDANVAMKCDATGLSPSTLQTCGGSQFCDKGVCQAQVCTPNQAGCNGTTAATCNANGSGYLAGGVDCKAAGKSCSAGVCVSQVCGNGVVEGTEGCDAGGLNGGGACSATCSCVNVGCGGDLDSAWSNVVLLMHMDGAQGSKVFVDEKGHLPSVVGAAVVSQTPVPKFGTGALSTATGGSYLSLPASVDWSYGTADFTAEAWVYPTVAEVGFCMHSLVFHTSFHFSLLWDDCDTTGKGMVSLPGQNLYFSRPATVNQWQHLAVVRQSGSFGVFVDGGLTVEGWQPVVANITGMLPLYIGANPDAPNHMHFPGYIDEARITKGVARYTSNFTPTKSAFGAPGSVGVCTANTPACLGNLAGTCNAAGTGLVSATDCAVSGKTCSAGLCASSFPSCKAALTANAAATDGVYAIDPDGAGPIAAANLFCDMKNGGLTLVANIYDSAGDDAPNDTSYVVSGWQQLAGTEVFASFSKGKTAAWLSQPDARGECQARGGDLAWITSASENSAASTACLAADGGAGPNHGCWLGGLRTAGVNSWMNGAAWSYTSWSPGQPSDASSSVWMYSSPSPGAGGWDDTGSEFKTSFVCRLPVATGDTSGAASVVAIGAWNTSVSTVARDSSGTGSAAVSLAFVAALKASAGQANLKMCFVHQNGTDTVCRNSADGSMTLVSFATGNPKLTVYSGDKLTYTFGRLAGLAGGVDGYDLSSDPGGAACVPKTPGQIGEFGTGPGICDHFGAVWPNYNGPVHYEGWGTTYAPVGVLNDELKGAAAANADAVANPNLNTYGFRLYIGL